jgi:hypothetical protein
MRRVQLFRGAIDLYDLPVEGPDADYEIDEALFDQYKAAFEQLGRLHRQIEASRPVSGQARRHELRARASRLVAERIEAERDGWKEIAYELLRVAFGEDAAALTVPPLELLEHKAYEKPVTAKLHTWWTDLIDAAIRARR